MLKHAPLALLLLSACVVDGDDLELEVDEDTSAITDGVIRNAQQHAVGLLTTAATTCSVTLIDHDVGLTSHACATKKGNVRVSGNRADVQAFRSIGNLNVVAVQLRKALPLVTANGVVTHGFRRGVDPVPLKAGDRVTCLGYSGGDLRVGIFLVADNSSDRQYFLRGVNSANGPAYTVTTQDVGGYCQRDGKPEIAAILMTETDSNGISVAEPMHKLGPALHTLGYVSAVARSSGAVKLRDPATSTFLTADAINDSVATQPLHGGLDDRHQSFYLYTVPPPAGLGGASWYRLVSVYDGRCLVAAKPRVQQAACDDARVDQVFYLGYQQIGGFDRYRLVNDTTSVQANGLGNNVTLTTTNLTQLNQLWEMWLTSY